MRRGLVLGLVVGAVACRPADPGGGASSVDTVDAVDTVDSADAGPTLTPTTPSPTGGSPSLALVVEPALAPVGDVAPLTAVLTLEAERPVTVALSLTDGERTWSYPVPGPASAQVDVPVVGGRAERTVEVTAILTDAAGDDFVFDCGSVGMPPLPEGVGVDLALSDPARMEPGYTLLPLGGYIGLLDDGGEIVWLLDTVGSIHELLPAEPGSMAYRFLSDKTDLVEVDVRGRLVRGWHAAGNVSRADTLPVDVLALHHDVQLLPDGTFLALSIERRLLDYPTSEVRPEAPTALQWVAGDVVVTFAADGSLIDTWPLLDRLDPDRVAYDAVDGVYWHGFGPFDHDDDVRDWSHGNAVSYDPVADRLIVGLRHQDAVVALERSTGELAWVLAPPANWSEPWSSQVLTGVDLPVWPYHMHGAKWTGSGTLMLFDNGNRRASAYERPLDDARNASRAVEYDVDPVAGTFSERWSYTPAERLFVGSQGDADPLPLTDNVLITWGNVKDPAARGSVRIQEVTRAGDTVFDVWLADGSVFRAQRVPGLFP